MTEIARLPSEFEQALKDIKNTYASWYADHALEDAESSQDWGDSWKTRNPYRVKDPGYYEHESLTARGENLWEGEYYDKAEYFDEAAARFYKALQHHSENYIRRPYLYGTTSPEEAAMEAIMSYDFDMDLPALILQAWEDSAKAQEA